jgi:hypothetical protein
VIYESIVREASVDSTSSRAGYLHEFFRRLDAVPAVEAPAGWKLLPPIHLSGLTDLGFSRDGKFILFITSQGRGLVDCETGQKVARDHDANGDWFDPFQLRSKGIGPAGSTVFETAGVHGGGLPLTNAFGDSLEAIGREWPHSDLFFCSAHGSIRSESLVKTCVKLLRDDFVAYGFSWCGNYFVVGVSDHALIWRRLEG